MCHLSASQPREHNPLFCITFLSTTVGDIIHHEPHLPTEYNSCDGICLAFSGIVTPEIDMNCPSLCSSQHTPAVAAGLVSPFATLPSSGLLFDSSSLGCEHLGLQQGLPTGVGGSTRLLSLCSTSADLHSVQRICTLFNTSMKATGARWCALFPWFFNNLEMNAPKDVRGGTKMIELRGLGEVAAYERIGLSYTSLRDVIAAQKGRRTLTTEVDDGYCLNSNHPRTPKSRLLEKAAHAWLQPTVCDRSFQHGNFFSRYWLRSLKGTNPTTAATRLVAPHKSSASLSSCIVFLPFLKWFDLSPRVERLREPPTFR